MGALIGYTTEDVQNRLDSIPTYVRPNLLDNAYFVGGGSQQGGGQFPINQRASASYTSTAFSIDRWYKANSTGTVSLSASGMTVAGTGSGWALLDQHIENFTDLFGKKVTLSVLTSSGLESVTYTMQSSLPGSETKWAGTSTVGNVVAEIRANASYIFVRLASKNASPATILAVKLELGFTQTLAHQENGVWVLNEIPNFQQELAKCQRYQTLLFSASNYARVALGYAESATIVHFFIPIPTTLRINNPTIEFFNSSLSNLFVYRPASGGYNAVNGATTTVAHFDGYFDLQITTTGLTTGEMVFLRTATENVTCIANANL